MRYGFWKEAIRRPQNKRKKKKLHQAHIASLSINFIPGFHECSLSVYNFFFFFFFLINTKAYKQSHFRLYSLCRRIAAALLSKSPDKCGDPETSLHYDLRKHMQAGKLQAKWEKHLLRRFNAAFRGNPPSLLIQKTQLNKANTTHRNRKCYQGRTQLLPSGFRFKWLFKVPQRQTCLSPLSAPWGGKKSLFLCLQVVLSVFACVFSSCTALSLNLYFNLSLVFYSSGSTLHSNQCFFLFARCLMLMFVLVVQHLWGHLSNFL